VAANVNRNGDDLSRPEFLTLGTFAGTPKIHFERLQVGSSRTRTLVIRNPTFQDTWVSQTEIGLILIGEN